MESRYSTIPVKGSTNAEPDLKPSIAVPTDIKPCCVCTEEKSLRDKCMLFSKAQDPTQECADIIDNYKRCMASYGFQIREKDSNCGKIKCSTGAL